MISVSELIRNAYDEDIPARDLTTASLALSSKVGDARLIAKEDLVLSGRQIFSDCIHHKSPQTELNWQFKDGDLALNRQVICWLKGDLIELLQAERVALNFLGHLSGIATLTRCFVQTLEGKCKILDTRKTTPLLRELEKAAVRAGGGFNHRMNLSSAILLKENHLRAAGGLKEAIRLVRQNTSEPIEVECTTLDEVKSAVTERVQRILLDNMTTAHICEARKLIPSVIEVEASGNMTLERVREVAECGVDFISVGALTHSAPVADVSLVFDWSENGRA